MIDFGTPGLGTPTPALGPHALGLGTPRPHRSSNPPVWGPTGLVKTWRHAMAFLRLEFVFSKMVSLSTTLYLERDLAS